MLTIPPFFAFGLSVDVFYCIGLVHLSARLFLAFVLLFVFVCLFRMYDIQKLISDAHITMITKLRHNSPKWSNKHFNAFEHMYTHDLIF